MGGRTVIDPLATGGLFMVAPTRSCTPVAPAVGRLPMPRGTASIGQRKQPANGRHQVRQIGTLSSGGNDVQAPARKACPRIDGQDS